MPAERVEVRETDSAEATLELGAALAARLPGGSVVLLQGDLGLGKTRLAKGIAMGLGLDPDDVLSPTFTLVHPHAPAPGRPGFVHVDLYRIAGPSELDELGLTELPGPDAVCAVEWPERLGARAAPGAVRVVIEDLGDTRRRFRVTWPEGPPPGRVI